MSIAKVILFVDERCGGPKWREVLVPFVPRQGDFILKAGVVEQIQLDTETQDIHVVVDGSASGLYGWTEGSPYPGGPVG